MYNKTDDCNEFNFQPVRINVMFIILSSAAAAVLS
jgi:hypothetical protein